MVINRICENENFFVVACFLPGRAKDLSASLCMYIYIYIYIHRDADKFLARPTSRCIFYGENISLMLVLLYT